MVGAVVGAVGAVVDLAGSPVVAELVGLSLSGLLVLLTQAVAADAYLQVREDAGGDVGNAAPHPAEDPQ